MVKCRLRLALQRVVLMRGQDQAAASGSLYTETEYTVTAQTAVNTCDTSEQRNIWQGSKMSDKIWEALRENNTSKVKALLENGADLEGATKGDGWSLLHHTAYTKGNLRMVKLLLDHKADVNAR